MLISYEHSKVNSTVINGNQSTVDLKEIIGTHSGKITPLLFQKRIKIDIQYLLMKHLSLVYQMVLWLSKLSKDTFFDQLLFETIVDQRGVGCKKHKLHY